MAIGVEYRRASRAVMISKKMTARLGIRYSTAKTVELWICQSTVLERSVEPTALSAPFLALHEP